MAEGKILQSLNKHSSITPAPTQEGRDVFALRAFWFVKLNISTVIKNSLDCHDVEKYLPPLRWRGKAEGGRAVPPSSPPPPSFSISGNWQIIHSLHGHQPTSGDQDSSVQGIESLINYLLEM